MIFHHKNMIVDYRNVEIIIDDNTITSRGMVWQ